jgi:hypothetical protein
MAAEQLILFWLYWRKIYLRRDRCAVVRRIMNDFLPHQTNLTGGRKVRRDVSANVLLWDLCVLL